MTNNDTRRAVANLYRLAETFERAAAIYDQTAASPTMQVLHRQAEQAEKLASPSSKLASVRDIPAC